VTQSAAEIRRVLQEQAARFSYSPRIQAAATHLLGRGKLYRPRLALATLGAIAQPDATGGASLVPLVTPLELIHTFTLIHDDLPCMDDADLRRGVPAVHMEYGEAIAVLAGDALCTMAFQVLARQPAAISADQRLRLVEALAEATQWVVAGQDRDLAAEGQELGVEALVELHRLKTGALLGACCEFGGILAGWDVEEAARLRELGWHIGLLFQIRDDLLSATGTEAELGKSVGTDEAKQKSTFVRALGVDGAKRFAEDELHELFRLIRALPLWNAKVLEETAQEAYWRET
jgi:geranylgeranyl diphosphate synthase, type II